SSEHAKRAGVVGSGGSGAGEYVSAYKRYTQSGPAPASYLAPKFAFAAGATQVYWQPSNPTEYDDVEVTITYTMPLHIPGAARVLGRPNGLYEMSSKAKLPSEAAKWGTQKPAGRSMGIDYQSQ
ncbi:MAG: hypothetical protein AAB393_01740, partial [Bacteroidota bacterium]